MHLIELVWCFVSLCCTFSSAVTDQDFQQLKTLIARVEKRQRDVISSLAKQVSQQQLHVEEMTRASGDSGLKLIRLTRSGSKPYLSTSYADYRFASIHNHPNYRGTVGLGEFVAVLNGVEFRTRHNDYKLRMPSRTSVEYGASEDIPYPDVPPEVLAQPTVNLQIREMREWFKAWKTGNHTVRDYRNYFKPNLCYLEGQWTNAEGASIDEPFQSERHFLDAESFFDLQNKIRYTSQTGRKSNLENYAYLPTTIAEVDKDGNIAYSQWNYQILCHPIEGIDIPLDRFEVEDDIGVRLAEGKTLDEFPKKRAARFSLREDVGVPTTGRTFTKLSEGTFLDKLMAQIPGKDNYPANVHDNFFGELAYPHDANLPANYKAEDNTTLPEPLNAGYYHKVYQVMGKDAMGLSLSRRGFSDNNLYVAYNTRSKVTPTKATMKCKPRKSCNSGRKKKRCSSPSCSEVEHRVSYAIPLEIIYTTPLQTWNPYNLTFFDSENQRAPAALNEQGVKRNGGDTNNSAYVGISDRFYSMTPIDFYESGNFLKDAADTVRRRGIGVLDQNGVIRQMVSSGISIFTREIPGVGIMRMRYPIMPLHDTGSSIYKDLKALMELTIGRGNNSVLYSGTYGDNGTFEDEMFTFETSLSSNPAIDLHTHTIELTRSQVVDIKAGKSVSVKTSQDAGHSHMIVLKLMERRNSIKIYMCDNGGKTCWDGHRGDISCTDCSSLGITN